MMTDVHLTTGGGKSFREFKLDVFGKLILAMMQQADKQGIGYPRIYVVANEDDRMAVYIREHPTNEIVLQTEADFDPLSTNDPATFPLHIFITDEKEQQRISCHPVWKPEGGLKGNIAYETKKGTAQ
jgi:hypothetical protein